jgi:hypothetical protein
MFIILRTALAAEADLIEAQRLEEKLSMDKLLMFRARTRMPTIS